MIGSAVLYQYIATLSVNLMAVAYGCTCGWPSASFLLLKSDKSPLESGRMSEEESSWVGSILCLGGVFGNLLFGWMSNKYGRKVSMLLVAIPQLLSWLLIIIAKNLVYLCVSRFLGGVAGGGAFVLIPIYVTEISEDKIRGSLGACLVFSCNIGILIAYVLSNYLSYHVVPYVLAIFPIIFLIAFAFLPETPQYLMKSNKEKEAEKSLRYFRNIRKSSKYEPPECFKAELVKLRNEFLYDDKINSDSSSLTKSDFNNRVTIKAFVIGLALMGINQLSGCFAMINYTGSIFQESGSNLSPNMSAIIVGVIQLLGAYVSTIMVDRAGRKLLISVSGIGTGIGLVCFGIYTLLKDTGYNLKGLEWIPIACFSAIIFIASWGVLTLPFVVLSEVMPPKLRSVGTSFCMTILWILAFIMVKCLPIIKELIGMHGMMFIFASFCFMGAIFVMAVIPETKGKSIDAILASM